MKDKLPVVTIQAHGDQWIDPDADFCCPECGAYNFYDEDAKLVELNVESRLEHKGSHEIERPFYDQYADIYFCHCKKCGCKFRERRNIKRKTNWACIIVLTVVVLVVAFFIVLAAMGYENVKASGQL